MSKRLPKKRRKEALRDRASAYADRIAKEHSAEKSRAFPNGVPITSIDVFNAFEDGYKAAMRDARAAWTDAKALYDRELTFPRMEEFLRPLK